MWDNMQRLPPAAQVAIVLTVSFFLLFVTISRIGEQGASVSAGVAALVMGVAAGVGLVIRLTRRRTR